MTFGTHMCHWPGCERAVPPRMWGCAPHWYSLPQTLRKRIWGSYIEGQEITKTPSPGYLKVAQEAYEFALEVERGRRERAASPTIVPVAGTAAGRELQEPLF